MQYLSLLVVLRSAHSLSAQGDSVFANLSGQLILLDQPPASLELDELTDDSALFVFVERTDYTLQNDLAVDMSQPGVYFPDSVPKDEQTWELLQPTSIVAGTRVHSIYFHYDNQTYNDSFDLSDYLNCIGQYQVNGQVTFRFPVLGVIMRASGNTPNLRDSDLELGVVGVDYCEHNTRHFPGINIVDGCQSDRFSLSDDRLTLTVRNNTDIHHDNYRVILDASGTSNTTETALKKIRAFPSPTTDIVQIDAPLSEPTFYIITDRLGQRLEQGQLSAPAPDISLGMYEAGVYYISLVSAGLHSTVKVIKQ